jgi:uncharacterized protein YodC (DUF2158 family)
MARVQAKALEVGDVVKLKSGGPAMTVLQVASPQTVKVVWFDPSDSLRTAEVTINSLTYAKRGK